MYADNIPGLDASAAAFAILGGAVGLKIGLYFLCVSMKNQSAIMLALAEDHLNDIMRCAVHHKLIRSHALHVHLSEF